MVERFEKFSYAIFEISRCWHKLAQEELERYGLKGSYATYFTAILRYEEGITAAQLSEICGKDKADVSRAMSLLERRGLVYRMEHDGNRYRSKLFLTEEGKRLTSYIKDRIAVAMEMGGQGLSEEQRIALYESLELITSNLHEMMKSGLHNEGKEAKKEEKETSYEKSSKKR